MKPTQYLVFLLLPTVYFSQTDHSKFIYDDLDVTVEKPDKNKSYDANYNEDNKIYKPGKKLTYSYSIVKNNQKYLIKKGNLEMQPEGFSVAGWEFVEFEKQNDETVNYITIEPHPGNAFAGVDPGYNQTAIEYKYVMKNNDFFSMETTGAIENDMNVWIHPPRNIYFEILELNPFPYIKAPYKIGTKWKWGLEIGDHWSDERWLKWEGGIENKYEYEIREKKNINTKLGNLECYIVYGKAKSRIGETELTSYFNEQFGFVKLEYTNIDGSKTFFELEKAE
ncbi:hypothetical protein BA768_03070 [Chryseobacterium sp. CBo1]|uniref:hypothetical protein n=1 Tax=Chryseobacterium sp. CBo1 TaxID=1869230 RepID=UPI00081086B4|nr:hypothetical protein [Chryseobacterium sp. CBo1]OCK51709.1 hypothetical protein BA768_03070 [Chryseobacterium sp. CBo1]